MERGRGTDSTQYSTVKEKEIFLAVTSRHHLHASRTVQYKNPKVNKPRLMFASITCTMIFIHMAINYLALHLLHHKRKKYVYTYMYEHLSLSNTRSCP